MFIGLERIEKFYLEKMMVHGKYIQKKTKKYIISLYKLGRSSDSKTHKDHAGDLKSYREDACNERGVFSDLDYVGKEIFGYGDESLFVNKLMELYDRSEAYFKNHSIEYRLVNQNCATWVNGILKAAGIADEERERIGEFSGIDWGEESDNLEDSFR
jgi:hypothetical protein